jgi:hypothetical protein
MYFIIKAIISGVLVALISEISRRYTIVGAILASMPITSILALMWLYRDTQSTGKVAEFSTGVLLIVFPSFIFFILLSLLLTKTNFGFYVSLALSCFGMAVTYSIYVWVLRKFGIQL